MAIHSSVLAWRIPGTGEPGGLPCLGSHEGLLFLHGLESNPGSSLQTEEEAGLP